VRRSTRCRAARQSQSHTSRCGANKMTRHAWKWGQRKPVCAAPLHAIRGVGGGGGEYEGVRTETFHWVTVSRHDVHLRASAASSSQAPCRSLPCSIHSSKNSCVACGKGEIQCGGDGSASTVFSVQYEDVPSLQPVRQLPGTGHAHNRPCIKRSFSGQVQTV